MHDQTDMMRLVINLFAAEKTEGLALSQSFWDINDLVTENENEALTAPFFSGNKGIKLVFSVVILLEIGSGRHACGGYRAWDLLSNRRILPRLKVFDR